jgi:hypothetical protein
MRRFSSGALRPAALTVLAVWACSGASLAACKSDSEASDAGATGDASAEALGSICDEFTEAGASCSVASAVACFPMCEAGGCFCTVKPGVGLRWVCVTDTTCLPDCAPLDESCGAQADGGAEGEAAAPLREAGE